MRKPGTLCLLDVSCCPKNTAWRKTKKSVLLGPAALIFLSLVMLLVLTTVNIVAWLECQRRLPSVLGSRFYLEQVFSLFAFIHSSAHSDLRGILRPGLRRCQKRGQLTCFQLVLPRSRRHLLSVVSKEQISQNLGCSIMNHE